MIHEAIETVEAVIWGAVISFGVIAAMAAFIIIALGYWAGVFAAWAWRCIASRIYPTTQPEATESEAAIEPDDEFYAHWGAWTADTRKEDQP
ncbi:hypothetical protein JL475_00150 [Streptomyces sp. M2CJ-2]|uniref:hypothetical protein n=1 Tax=Streptomyces sp. M2CJ-2 TaxID=2803948 RepID=UPI001920D821|nr:hypothetical protein [Streptomyces sp. M2CJ-2]MBL3664456.1 hypothetical protein [Streptomyces sp. M2CJ-2]